MLRSALITVLTLCSTLAWALPQESRVPGGVALINLPASANVPQVDYQGNRVMVVPAAQSEGWVAVVGIPLSANVSEQQKLSVNGKPMSFGITDKAYPEQRLQIKEKNNDHY